RASVAPSRRASSARRRSSGARAPSKRRARHRGGPETGMVRNLRLRFQIGGTAVVGDGTRFIEARHLTAGALTLRALSLRREIQTQHGVSLGKILLGPVKLRDRRRQIFSPFWRAAPSLNDSLANFDGLIVEHASLFKISLFKGDVAESILGN